MVERREGGEKGVKWLQAYRGDKFWEAHHEELWSRELFEAASLSRSHTLTPSRQGFNNIFPTLDEMKQLVEDPIAYQYEHLDGLKATMILMNGLVQDFNFAAHLEGQDAPLSTQMYLPMPPARTTLANFFSPLVNNVEQMFLSWSGDLSGRAHAAYYRVGCCWCREPLSGSDTTGDATPEYLLSTNGRINFLENLIP